MYQKTVDRHHFQRRIGSHATKGSGRGTVWWAPQNLEELNLPLEVRKTMAQAWRAFKNLIAAQEREVAKEPKNVAALRAIRAAMRALNKNAKATIRAHTIMH